MKVPITGGCNCGEVRFEISAEPQLTWICHCRECQRFSGGGGMTNIVFQKSDVRFTKGTPISNGEIGTSGNPTRRGFCPSCGCSITASADVFPDVHGICAASLDDPTILKVVAHIWTDSMQPWDIVPEGVAQFGKTPSMEELGELLSAE